MNPDRRALLIGCLVGAVALGCLVVLASVAVSLFAARRAAIDFQENFDFGVTTEPGPTPEVIRPTDGALEDGVLGDASFLTVQLLTDTIVPAADRVDLAQRLLGVGNVPATVTPPSSALQVGAKDKFWVTDNDSRQSFEAPATLRYVTAHSYFWIGDDVNFDQSDLRDLAEAFENVIYPTDREFFGSEWTPGIDGDPHIYIVYVRGIGFSVAGYFSGGDEVHPLADEHSNAHEMFVLNADAISLSESFTYEVLAHEFQHMIHHNLDGNETSWINEGFSEVAVLLYSISPGRTFADIRTAPFAYISNPDIQLTDWPADGDTGPHYAASFSFLTYFLGRLGEEVTRALVAHPANSLESIDAVLVEQNITDPLTGALLTADDLVLDWTLANYILDEDVSDGRYFYSNYPSAPQADETETIDDCSPGAQTNGVHQHGVEYIRITCSGAHTLLFEGSLVTELLPEPAFSGDFAFWSNKGDQSDMTLTRTFDFSGQSGPLTFTYWTWYDIEEDWDYVYVLASTDGGATWEFIETPLGTDFDPIGNNYGYGYTAASGDWVEESVDISQFAGQTVQLRFEYVTDDAVNGEGLLLDDISIPETGYFTDFETDDGGWEANGFARVHNVIPQTFRIALITYGDTVTVQYLTLDADNSLEIPFTIGGDVEEVVLVVIGTTRFTRQPAAYRLDFLP